MTTLTPRKVKDVIEEIFDMTSAMDVIRKATSISMSDIDQKARRFINKALDAQLALLRAKEVLRADLEHG